LTSPLDGVDLKSYATHVASDAEALRIAERLSSIASCLYWNILN
jgi:hypothetical protein